MGILSENLVWLLAHARPASSILELGNQFLYVPGKPFDWYPDKYLNPTMDQPVAAKPFFLESGYDHVSIDLNGKDGAQPIDLSQPFNLGRYFDNITDFGTSEHVIDLWQCLKNLDQHAKVGTQFFHVNPLTGNWPKHGYWYRSVEFYKAFAGLTGYALWETRVEAACGNTTDGWNIWARMTKVQDRPFPSREAFDKLPINRS